MERDKEIKLEEVKEEEMQRFEAKTVTVPCSSPITVQSSHSSSQNNVSTSIISNVSESSSTSNVLQVSTSDKLCQTAQHLTDKTPRKIKLLDIIHDKNHEIKNLKKELANVNQQLVKVSTVKQMLKLCQQHLPPSMNLIIKAYVDRKNKKSTSYRYSNEFKQLAQTIYFLGPKVYKFLQSTLALPNPCTLRRVTK